MNSQELRALQEAYNQVYELDESAIGDRARNAVADQRLDAAQRDTQQSVNKLAKREKVTRASAHIAAKKVEGDVRKSSAYGPQRPKPGTTGAYRITDSFDVYDVILSHLLDEGYADTEQAAQVIMVNMSEDWRESIVEEEEVLAQKGGVPGTMRVKPTKEGGFLGIGAKTVNKPVAGSFKRTDIGSEDAARYNTGIDKKFGSADNIDNTSAANVQYAANRAGHSGYMKVKDPGSLPNTGIPNRPTPGRASDQNQARQMSSDIVRMNRR